MCGIAGLYSAGTASPPQRDELETMMAMLAHRGPDGRGTFLDRAVGLGHTRLSIIDVEGGAQPLTNEDGTVQVVFNGEIFNYVELREALLRQGHRFATRSDTEVLVHLYEEHGDRFVEELNGQFAIALWDVRRQRLVLARDRVGIRPLFYTWTGNRLAFASEAKALLALPGVSRRLDAAALASIFSYWSPLPPTSVFAGIAELPPGHRMTVEHGRADVQRWWEWSFPGASLDATSEEECAERLRDLLVDAVRLQLRSDVPVGAYVSGGLDSSMVTSIVARRSATPLRTFSLTFEDAELDEDRHQRELVGHLRTEHSSMVATRAAIAAAFPRTVWHAEAPVVRTAPAPMMMLADSVRAAGYKVVLTGEGADEVFGGYELFKEAKIRRFVARAPASRWRSRLFDRLYQGAAPAAARPLMRSYFMDGIERPDAPAYAHAARRRTTRRVLQFFNADWRARLDAWDPDAALAAVLPRDFARWEPLERDQFVEAHTLLSGYLLSSQGDRMAMAASVETRYPFLDHRVIEFGSRLPPRWKLRGLKEKVLLRRAARTEIPPTLAGRPKQAYRAPDSACFFVDGKPLPYVAELLGDRSLRDAGLFDPAAVGRLIEKCRAGRATGFGDNMAFVAILSTMLLHEQLVRTAPRPIAP